jgi:probable rRNA maturation factor
MKFSILLFDTARKMESPSALRIVLPKIEQVFLEFLITETQFKSVKNCPKVVSLNLTLCGKNKIRSLNREYRKKDKVTDVLSFPLIETVRAEQIKMFNLRSLPPLPELSLGDVVICKEVAQAQARELKMTYRDELIHLFVHGFLHVLGYDHEVSLKEEKIMEKYEEQLVLEISKKLNKKGSK